VGGRGLIMFEVGNTLREARMRRGLDILDCEAATKIRGRYLRALEEEQFEMLPGPTFVRGFLRTYSDYLGLDGRLVLEEYETRFERPKELSAFEEAMRRNRSHRRSRESRLLMVLAAVAMAGSVAGWVAAADGPAENPAPFTPVAAIPPAHGASVELTFVATSPTTVEAWNGENGQNTVLERVTVSPGAAEQVIAAPPVSVRIGRPGSIRMRVDGRPVTVPPRATRFEVGAAGEITVTR